MSAYIKGCNRVSTPAATFETLHDVADIPTTFPMLPYMHAGCNNTMNIVQSENESIVIIAKTCGCQNTGSKVTYTFVDQTHALCHDKKDVIQAEIEACERLLKYAEGSDKKVIEKELAELRMALDLMP